MATWVNLMDLIFPIGSFYISRQSTSPASIIGGSWTQVTDAVLRGSTGIGYTGSDTHALTVNEMPSHTHSLYSAGYGYDWNAGGGANVNANSGDKVHDVSWKITSAGGGKHIRLCNALTIAISGIEPLSCSKNPGGVLNGLLG